MITDLFRFDDLQLQEFIFLLQLFDLHLHDLIDFFVSTESLHIFIVLYHDFMVYSFLVSDLFFQKLLFFFCFVYGLLEFSLQRLHSLGKLLFHNPVFSIYVALFVDVLDKNKSLFIQVYLDEVVGFAQKLN